MLLLILLLASSGIVLASPRVKGLPLAQSSGTHSYGEYYYSSPELRQGAGVRYQPTVQIVPESSDDDSGTVLVRISAKDLQHFKVQQSSASYPRKTVDNQLQGQVIPDAHFTVPSRPNSNVQSDQGNRFTSHLSVQPDYQLSNTQNSPQVSQYSAAFQAQETARRQRQQDFLIKSSIGKILRDALGNSQMISMRSTPDAPYELPDNFTSILIEPLKETFSCENRLSGYYADVDNNCQIFHVCLSMEQIFPDTDFDDTLQYSFICNNNTQFSQDVMVCTYQEEAVPCEASPQLYDINKNLYRIVPDPDGSGEKYAELNHPLPEDS